MLGGILVLLFNLTQPAMAQSNCIKLEGLNLGCVSSIDHSCFLNKKVDEKNSPCRYVSEPSTQWRVEAPISFKCKSATSTTVCPPRVCNPDGCVQPPCTTTSECTEYQPPSCDETCVKCFSNVVNANVGISKGCIICTREMCPDERDKIATAKCPTKYNNMILHNGDKCSSDSRCPTTAVDPLGQTHTVIINRNTCPPPIMPEEPPEPPNPKDCPWKVDQRSSTGCERIQCSNQNPQAEPNCVDP